MLSQGDMRGRGKNGGEERERNSGSDGGVRGESSNYLGEVLEKAAVAKREPGERVLVE